MALDFMFDDEDDFAYDEDEGIEYEEDINDQLRIAKLQREQSKLAINQKRLANLEAQEARREAQYRQKEVRRKNQEAMRAEQQLKQNASDYLENSTNFSKTAIGSFGALAGPIAFGAQQTFNQVRKQQEIGCFNGNILQYSYGTPFIRFIRNRGYMPDEYAGVGSTQGYPSNKYIILKEGLGFVRCKSFHLEIPNATQEELNEIESLLKKGVIL